MIPLCSLLHFTFGLYVNYKKEYDCRRASEYFGIDEWIERCYEDEKKKDASRGRKRTKSQLAADMRKRNVSKMNLTMEKRLREWSHSKGHVMIESIIHPMRNGKKLLLLNQFQGKQRQTANFIVVDASKIDSFINSLTETKAKLAEKTETIVIDEWDLNSSQSIYRKTLANLTAERIKEMYWSLMRETCVACEYDVPAQETHLCNLPVDENIKSLFAVIMNRINFKELNAACCKNLKIPVNENQFPSYAQLLEDQEWKNYIAETVKKRM